MRVRHSHTLRVRSPPALPSVSSRSTLQGLRELLHALSALSAAEALHLIGQLAVWQNTTRVPSNQPTLPGLVETPSGRGLQELFNAEFTPRRGAKKLDVQHFHLAF